MNATFKTHTFTETIVAATSAGLLSVMTIGAVMALFSTATPDAGYVEPVAVDTVVMPARAHS